MKRKNKGYTLPELVVFLAIMGVVIAGLLWNASSVFGFSARECCNKLGAKISQTKIDTLGKAKNTGDVKLVITQNDKGKVFVEEFINGVSQEKTQISKRKVLLSYTEAGTKHMLDESTSYTVSFNRSTGALVQSDLEKIEVIAGNHTYTIKFWPVTGKISY